MNWSYTEPSSESYIQHTAIYTETDEHGNETFYTVKLIGHCIHDGATGADTLEEVEIDDILNQQGDSIDPGREVMEKIKAERFDLWHS